MEKVSKSNIPKLGIKLICWDLDGTLCDTESVWFKMPQLVTEKYGCGLNKEETNIAQEKIAADMYLSIGYRANAGKALNYFKKQGIKQYLINQCPLTNKAMIKNSNINSQFEFAKFDDIISSENFSSGEIGKKEMYLKALEVAGIKNAKQVIAIEDLPDGLDAAKKAGMITVWAKNPDYPFTEDELIEINNLAEYYIEDFFDLVS